MSTFLDRVASAPISWGICEVPGWGAMLPTPRVLREMSGLGMPATELGAPGFLPTSPEDVRATLDEYDMSLIGGFTPLVLHNPEFREASIAEARRVADLFQRAGATEFISAIVFDPDWSVPTPLNADERKHLMEMFAIVDEICAEYGLDQVMHSHVQTVVETKDDIDMVLNGCDVNFCLDTGHMAIGGQDPVEFARSAFDRVGHVHLKDVNLSLVPPVLAREKSLMAATQEGLFTPLGQGDVDIAGVVRELESRGYDGWYVIEQDTAITDGLPAEGEGPMAQVVTSLDYLRDVVAPTIAATGSAQ
jgi:inosose dehydratase